MGSGVADFLHAEDREGMAVYFGVSDVSILTAHLGKEYSLVCNDEYLVVLLVDFEDLCITAVLLKAEKFSDGIRLYVECADDGLFLRGAGTFALLLHVSFYRGFVER